MFAVKIFTTPSSAWNHICGQTRISSSSQATVFHLLFCQVSHSQPSRQGNELLQWIHHQHVWYFSIHDLFSEVRVETWRPSSLLDGISVLFRAWQISCVLFKTCCMSHELTQHVWCFVSVPISIPATINKFQCLDSVQGIQHSQILQQHQPPALQPTPSKTAASSVSTTLALKQVVKTASRVMALEDIL